MTAHSLLLNSITSRAHILCLVLHRQKQTEEGHSFHHCVATCCSRRQSYLPAGGLGSSSLLARLQNNYGRACFEIRPDFGNCISEKAWSVLVRRYKQLFALMIYLLALTGSLEYTELAFIYTDGFFTRVCKLREKQDIFWRRLSTTGIGGMEDTRNALSRATLVKAERMNKFRMLRLRDHKTFS